MFLDRLPLEPRYAAWADQAGRRGSKETHPQERINGEPYSWRLQGATDEFFSFLETALII